jgi:hypothetical protein
MKAGSHKCRVLRLGAGLLATIVLVGAAHAPILREIASFLIVEDSLRPAAAIVALGGQAPFRQIEAARLYHAGWAPLVFVVQEGGLATKRKHFGNWQYKLSLNGS